MKKNTIRVLFLFLMCGMLMFAALPFTAAAEGTASVSVGSASGKAGDTVIVDVKLSDNPGVIAMNLGVDFDSNKLELVGANNTGVLNGYSSSSDYSGGHYVLNWEDALATTPNNANGTVATLTFKLKEDCDSATVSVSGTGHDANAQAVNVSGGRGTITNTNPPSTTSTTAAASTTSGSGTQSTTANSGTSTTNSSSTSTTKAATSSTTKRVTTTAAYTRSYYAQNTYPVDYQVEVVTEPELTTVEESTTDMMSIWEMMTEPTTLMTTTMETTTEVEEQKGAGLSKTKLILIILMACFAIVGIAIIVSMVRKSKG